MKREQIIAFGVPEERIREFQAAYWADLHKCAQRMAADNTDQQTADEARSLLEAITAMVKLMPDPERLKLVLNNVNRHYAQYTQGQREKQEQERQTANDVRKPLEG